MLQTIENIVFDTGQLKQVPKAIGVAESTLYGWLSKRPELMEAVTRARKAHKKFRDRAFQGEMMSAMEGLNKLLNGYTEEFWEETIRQIRNEETGEVLETIEVTKRQRHIHIRPDIRAIEKVLGPNEIRLNIYMNALEDHVLNSKSELYKLVFGKLIHNMEETSIEEFLGISVLNVQLDLLKLRYMEAHVQHLYDNSHLSVDQWLDLTSKLRRDYGMISDRMETRAQKLLEGASYQDVLYQMEELWRVLIETTSEEMRRPLKLKGRKTPYTVPVDAANKILENIVDKINERKSNETYFIKRIT